MDTVSICKRLKQGQNHFLACAWWNLLQEVSEKWVKFWTELMMSHALSVLVNKALWQLLQVFVKALYSSTNVRMCMWSVPKRLLSLSCVCFVGCVILAVMFNRKMGHYTIQPSLSTNVIGRDKCIRRHYRPTHGTYNLWVVHHGVEEWMWKGKMSEEEVP